MKKQKQNFDQKFQKKEKKNGMHQWNAYHFAIRMMYYFSIISAFLRELQRP